MCEEPYALIVHVRFCRGVYGVTPIFTQEILLRYQKVTVYIYSFNERSMKIHESLGFQCEGRIRRAVYTNGNYYDEVLYGMTSEEFDMICIKDDL